LTLQPPSMGSMAIFHPHLNPPTEGSGPFLVDSTHLSSEATGTSKAGGLSSSDSRVNLQLRINARYKSVDVLPLRVYWPLHSVSLKHASVRPSSSTMSTVYCSGTGTRAGL
uniref:Capsid protein n=1 Tax=Schistocephalus solidus TaxID=70667 RepID=A0A183TU51_SCHSO